MSEQKKFKFEDLQPHVEVLIDALENKGASPSGVSYKAGVYKYPPQYRELLAKIRNKTISFEDLLYELHLLKHLVMEAAGDNQRYRIQHIVDALDTFLFKEYQKFKNEHLS